MRALCGRLVLCAAAMLAIDAGRSEGQTATASPAIFGTVRTAEGAFPLSYSVVSIPALGREQFSNDRGNYTMRELPAGTHKLRFRHIGFMPHDTTVVLRPGDTLQVDMRLARLAIRLDAMRVSAACDAGESAEGKAAITDLLEQVRENAAQFKLLVKTYPYTKYVTRWDVERLADGSTTGSPAITTTADGNADAHYEPGRIFRTVGGRRRGVPDVIVIPVLPDFADSVFIVNHCFTYGGDTTVDSTRYVRVAFTPVKTLTEPDIAGTVTLRADGFGIFQTDLRVTAIPRNLDKQVTAIRAVTTFREILPGIAIVALVESFLMPGPAQLKSAPNVVSRGEIQMQDIRWKNGPP